MEPAASIHLQAKPYPGQGVPSQLLVIIDDSVTNLKILERLALSLGGGTAAKSFADAGAALEFCAQYRPTWCCWRR